jgi:hypothetical protein
MCFGVRHASTANCSSSGLSSLNQPSPSTWSSDVDRPVRGKTFLRNRAPDTAAMDLFVFPTVGFKMRIDRRDIVWINVTTNPTAEWIARPPVLWTAYGRNLTTQCLRSPAG